METEGLLPSEDTTEPAVERKTRPPTRRTAWYERFFDILQSRKIDFVDLDFIKTNIAPDTSDARRFLGGLKFLGLVDENGKSTAKLEKLRLTGEDFDKNFAAMVQDAYKDVFDKVIVDSVKSENLTNFFIEKYGFGGSVANDAVTMFVYFADKAKIPLSESLKSPRASQKPQRVDRPRTARDTAELDSEKTKNKQSQEVSMPDNVEELRIGDVRVWLPKGDLKAAQTAKSLIDLYVQSLQ